MEYFDEMFSPGGFRDGNGEPPQARKCRAVYCRAINALAERYGSAFRAVPVDYTFHNSRRILVVPKSVAEALLSPTDDEGLDPDKHDLKSAVQDLSLVDEEFQSAVKHADSLDLDECVRVQADINWKQVDDELGK